MASFQTWCHPGVRCWELSSAAIRSMDMQMKTRTLTHTHTRVTTMVQETNTDKHSSCVLVPVQLQYWNKLIALRFSHFVWDNNYKILLRIKSINLNAALNHRYSSLLLWGKCILQIHDLCNQIMVTLHKVLFSDSDMHVVSPTGSLLAGSQGCFVVAQRF